MEPAAQLIMHNCTLTSHAAVTSDPQGHSAMGGAIYLSSQATAALTGCTMTNCTAWSMINGLGGVLYVETLADVTLTNCTIRDAAARSPARGARGGMGSRIPSMATCVATAVCEIPSNGMRPVSISQHTTPKLQRSHLWL